MTSNSAKAGAKQKINKTTYLSPNKPSQHLISIFIKLQHRLIPDTNTLNILRRHLPYKPHDIIRRPIERFDQRAVRNDGVGSAESEVVWHAGRAEREVGEGFGGGPEGLEVCVVEALEGELRGEGYYEAGCAYHWEGRGG